MMRKIGSEKKGGRNKASEAEPELLPTLELIVEDHTAGSPVDPAIRWTNRSPQEIAGELADYGFSVCAETVQKMLTEDLHLRLRKARKDEAGGEFPFRNEQFEQIADLRQWYEKRRWPVLSMDVKKKELLGNYFRDGEAFTDDWLTVRDHDFIVRGEHRLVPHGLYDPVHNEGWMYLARGSDTSELAHDSVWRWWQVCGRRRYWHASGLLLLCDCGGGNSYRHHVFKEDMKRLAIRLRRPIQIAHYPPYTSKYNPIERRLFCHISRVLKGVILTCLDVAQNFISRTSTSTGLRVITETTEKIYRSRRQATEWFRKQQPVDFAEFLPQLNYTLTPLSY